MRALFVIDANSEEIVFSKRFTNVEQRLGRFFKKPQVDSIFKSYRDHFQYTPMPDNGIFKLAFSRDVISRTKLENEKQLLPHLQDYPVDQEDWEHLQNTIQRQLAEEITQFDINESPTPLLFKLESILSLRVNMGAQQAGELWPTLSVGNGGGYYVVSVISVIEDSIFEAVMKDRDILDIAQQARIKVIVEERSIIVMQTLEYIKRVLEIIKFNAKMLNKDQLGLWSWLKLMVDMTVPFGTIQTSDFAHMQTLISNAASCNVFQDFDKDESIDSILLANSPSTSHNPNLFQNNPNHQDYTSSCSGNISSLLLENEGLVFSPDLGRTEK